ncbi:hypothetical protein G6F57_007249 [Rhizopus arrhizus]|uniref:sphingomyelin phosphodiesterase n=1 Tax=Rhizopus oryzae TaxID=64495 RepID=A0A9P6X0K0_RHIOR|nr:hypothetical protein G6F24_001781 [Rhizopus arrhizus]KAG1401625.1 hypothetical protein G6F58_010708 [Rhizopus delemar]KAG0794293.1 hypothetical protein G6F22_005392 [Rhizopus arrhizus]KAG0795492.1 hypothetical protein G6F21_002056 [Rhizopus arrhizus]KAG0807033.1 hypothetical protein G6F20_010659 [Rhizopus arrhizus]
MDSRERSEEEINIPDEPYQDNVDETNETDNEDSQEYHPTPTRARLQAQNSYASSIISTQSAPPPYELYPPAKTVWGRFYNWVRQIPRFNTHQAIYLPTLSRYPSTLLSRTESSHSYWSCYYSIRDRMPRWTLPVIVARHRLGLICFSSLALILFSFLLFCSVFFAPGSLPEPTVADKVAEGSVRVLTLNMMMRPPLIRNNWSDYKEERLSYVERYLLAEYDLIVFQEVYAFASRRKDRLIRSARRMGFNHHLESPHKYPWDLASDGGLLLLSRFPIRQSDVLEYPRGPDWFSIQGALHALIDLTPDRPIHLYTTHLASSAPFSQLALFRSFVQATSEKDKQPILIAGDFSVDAAVHGSSITERSRKSSRDYVQLVNRLKLDDLQDAVYHQLGYHPVTLGDYTTNPQGELVPAETVLTDWDRWLTVQSVDRLFWVPRNTSRLTVASVQVEKFLVKENSKMTSEEKQVTEFTQVSDHYGLSCMIQIN